MKKAFIKLAAVVITAVSVLSPLSANALYTETDKNSPEYQEMMSDFTLLEDFHMFDTPTWIYSEVYVNSRGTQFLGLREINKNISVFNLTEGTDQDTVNAALKKEFNQYYGIGHYSYGVKYDYYVSLDTRQAKEVCAFLKEQNMVDSFVYFNERYTVDKMYVPYLLTYPAKDKEALAEYIEENGADYQLVDKVLSDGTLVDVDEGAYEINLEVALIPDSEKTILELAEFAREIYDETGLGIDAISPASINNLNSEIDVYNSVDGDANCDGRVTVADAVAILQSIGNRDKYPLSAQGSFNADIVGDYDGITAADALAIQQLDAQSGI